MKLKTCLANLIVANLNLQLNRIQGILNYLNTHKIDALVVTKLPNVRYLSGFSGSAGYLVLAQKAKYFVSDFRYKIQASREINKSLRVKIDKQGSFDFIREISEKYGLKRIGFESGAMVYSQVQILKKVLKGKKLVPVDGLIEQFTTVKTNDEIDNIRYAVKITDKVFSKLLAFIKPGITETDIAAELTYLQIKGGASGNSFSPIVASGENSAFPHAQPTNRKLKSGDLLTLDFGCIYNGFCSDMTRTIGIGKLSAEAKKIYQIVSDAQQLAINSIAKNKSTKVVDSVARNYIHSKGYGKYFGHGLGHGLGIEVHENPRLNQISNSILTEGNVVTVEPGIYIENFGGVRIEDDVIVTEDGCEVLNSSPKELIII